MKKRLLDLIESKETNLALSADVTRSAELIALADKLGPEICILKTHIDILSDFTPAVTTALRALADKHNFLIFEDRKFADIGNTVKQQYAGGIYQIADWADIINAHIVPGPGIIEGLREIGLPKKRALLLLAEMSSRGSLDFSSQAITLAQQYSDFVIGFIARRKLLDGFLTMTPGIQLQPGSDNLGQQYLTPEMAISQGSDVLIVGRGITHAPDPLAAAKIYRERGWYAACS